MSQRESRPTTPGGGDFRTYLVSYQYDGAKWSLEVRATSEEDAMFRLRRASNYGTVDGELMLTIPATPGAGPLTRLICWWKNL